ncbi:hypothetical protein O0L34_g11134 [Tuta absoluta]|nr:hypothetical protein O0L34_g11134 [Tuta absoluta]
MATIVNESIDKFTPEQRDIFDTVVQSVSLNEGKLFHLDAPGGTGKTFLTSAILAEIRRQGKIALAVASSGIAATLLPGGKTAHTTFKIPINLDINESPVCAVSRNSDKARILEDCCLIVWDECTMANKKAVEAVDKTLRDIRRDNRAMGHVTVLFSGDFRQTLPVVTRGTRADEVNASLKRSSLWLQIHKLTLTVNMRARLGGNSRAEEFSQALLKFGEGTMPENSGQVSLPETLCRIVSGEEELISSVYGEVSQILQKENSWLNERAILAPKNDRSMAINQTILSQITGDEVVYTSINTVMNQDEATNYPTEFLNSLSANGLPAHQVTLKVGVPIMLLRNLSPPKLCNGTRLKVINLQRNLIEADILTGCGAGETVLIPRIPLIPNNFPFEFKRVQFPVSVCFAMTINKQIARTDAESRRRRSAVSLFFTWTALCRLLSSQFS